ncbi:hypothetical protein [Phenylobacterium sp.]|uniref:hypothetical protein n=1 Tax=Phenylobacterium sp. TaxID=1871053 RepID=UPI002CFBB826|nr:hypothetical protein [Phenylobacterium sp.]HLZ75525.1 hypothetical protein [Phenylobacterium sp.]
MVEAFENVLLVAFLHVPPPGALKLWSAAFDEEPTGYQTPPPGLSPIHNQALVQGNVDGYAVTLGVQSARVDINISAPNPTQPMVPPPSVGDLQTAIDFAIARMAKLLPNLKVGRAAMVVQGHTATESDEKSIEVIRGWLPTLKIPDQSTDVTYQVTVPRASTVRDGRLINQLCRWQSVQMQMIQFQIGTAMPSKPVSGAFVAVVYIDVFGKDLEVMDDEAALAALKEVSERAAILASGGINELS